MEHDTGDGHKAWKAKLEEKKARRKNETSNTSITKQGNYEKIQLKLSDKLQVSMVTDLQLSKDKVDHLMTIYNSGF